MHSDLISKIEKAKRYAAEPERVTINQLRATFRGGNDHSITLENDHWSCDCRFYTNWQTCSHVMALQRMLGQMITDDARKDGRYYQNAVVADTVADAVG
jgi:hypothetical protein